MPLDFPVSPSLNDTYTFGDKTWIWNGQGWALNPSGNVTANNISVIGNVTASYYFGNGTQLAGVPNTTVSSSPPSSPEQGDIWIDSDTAVQLIYFNDGNSSQWAEMEAQTSFTTEALPQNITATTVVATGNITAGNLITTGLVSATGNLTAGNLTTTGNLNAGNLITTGLISATGNLTAGNLTPNNPLAVAYGGTGATTATNALDNLGAASVGKAIAMTIVFG